MGFESIEVRILFDREVDPAFLIEFLHECLDNGCTTERDGKNGVVRYDSELTNWVTKEAETNTAFEHLGTVKSGSLDLWLNEFDISLYINLIDSMAADKSYNSIIGFSIEPVYFKRRSELHSPEEAQQNVLDFIKLVASLYEFATPAHVFGNESSIAYDQPVFDTPVEYLEQGIVEEIFWLNIFSPTTVEQLGRERVLSAPAWMVEELDDGGILLVLADNPLEVGEVRAVGKEVEKHLGLT